jgi:hypothetical protein
VSPWLSIRMNDMHGANSWEGSYMNCALQKDPRYRLSGREVNPHGGVNRMGPTAQEQRASSARIVSVELGVRKAGPAKE